MKRENTQQTVRSGFQVGQEFDVVQLALGRRQIDLNEKRLADLKREVSRSNLSEDEIKDMCNQAKHDISRPIATQKHYLINKESKLLARQETITPEFIHNHYQDRADFEKNRRMKPLNMQIKTLSKMQSRKSDYDEEIKHLRKQKRAFQNPPAVRTLLNRLSFYVLILCGLSFGDAVISFSAMRGLAEGISNAGLMWITLLLAGAISIGAHLTAKTLAKNGLTKGFFAALLVSGFFVFILIWLRIDMKSSAVLSALNLAFFLMATLVSYHRYSKSQDYWNIVIRITKLKKLRRNLNAKIQHLQRMVSSDKHSVEISLRNLAIEQSTTDVLFNNEKLVEIKNAILGMEKVKGGYDRRADLIGAAAITRVTERAIRKKNGFVIPNISFPNILKKAFFTIGVIVLMTACTTKTETASVVVLMDLTESNNDFPDAEVILSEVGGFEAGQITLSAITDTHAYPYHVVNLESPKSYFLQVKEDEDSRLSNFKNEFKIAYETLRVPLGELQYSFVFSAMNTHLVKLSESNAQRKQFLCYSDLLQHSPAFSFYAYRHNPKQILKDYQRIVSKFEAEYENMKGVDLNGIDIAVMYTPQKKDDALYRYTSLFWMKFFKDKGAGEVKFIPLLPQSENEIKVASLN